MQNLSAKKNADCVLFERQNVCEFCVGTDRRYIERCRVYHSVYNVNAAYCRKVNCCRIRTERSDFKVVAAAVRIFKQIDSNSCVRVEAEQFLISCFAAVGIQNRIFEAEAVARRNEFACSRNCYIAINPFCTLISV